MNKGHIIQLVIMAVLLIGSIVCMGFCLGNYLKIQKTVDEQAALIQEGVEQDNQRKEAQRLVEEDEFRQWRNNINTVLRGCQWDISNLRGRVDGLDRKLIEGIPFQATGGVYPHQRYLIIVEAIDTISEDGKGMGGRVLGEFDNVQAAITYLEGIK